MNADRPAMIMMPDMHEFSAGGGQMLGSRTGLYRMVIVVKTAIVGYNTGRNLL
jgi:hypothetical protein